MMSDYTINEMMEAYSQDAVDYVYKIDQTKLDFSETSVKTIERISANLHEALPRGIFSKILKQGPSEDNIENMAKMLGGYLGEVIRRQWGGEWSLETTAQVGKVLTLHVKSSDIFPTAKVYKRITNGSEDNLWHYYQVLKSDFMKSEPTC